MRVRHELNTTPKTGVIRENGKTATLVPAGLSAHPLRQEDDPAIMTGDTHMDGPTTFPTLIESSPSETGTGKEIGESVKGRGLRETEDGVAALGMIVEREIGQSSAGMSRRWMAWAGGSMSVRCGEIGGRRLRR